MSKRAMLVTPMENPEDYQYDIDCAEVAELWRRGSVVGSWLLDLTADVLRRDREDPGKFDGELAIVVRAVGLSTLLWILVYPHLSSLQHYLNGLTQEDSENSQTKS